MLPHRIRLRGPWNVLPDDPAGQPRVVTLPAQWDQIASARAVQLERHFGWTAALASYERLWLVLKGLSCRCGVSLNGQFLSESNEDVQFDITPEVRERNVLRVDCTLPTNGPLWNEIALEVRGQAWLDDLSAKWAGDRILVTGRVLGQIEGTLDLYAIRDRRPILHEVVSAGSTFELATDVLPHAAAQDAIHVELMLGSFTLHAAEVPVSGSQAWPRS